MAIAFDASGPAGTFTSGATSISWSHTTSGSDRLLIVAVTGDTASDAVTGATYNSVAMSLVNKRQVPNGGRWLYQFILPNPTSGSNTVVVNASASIFMAALSASYTGCQQTGQPDSQNTGSAASTSLAVSTTVVASNCWLVGNFGNNGGTGGDGTGTTLRQESSVISRACAIYDSTGTVGTGSQALEVTLSPSGDLAGIVASIAPVASASAVLTGTAIGGITEADIVSGGRTIIVTLTGDTFIAS